MELSIENINLVKEFLNKELATKERVIAVDIYKAISEKLQPQMSQAAFTTSFSVAMCAGKVDGFYTKKGPKGGVYKGSKNEPITRQVSQPVSRIVSKPEVASEENKSIVESPKPYLAPLPIKTDLKKESLKNVLYTPSEKFYMSIGDHKFEVPCHKAYIQSLLDRVYEAKEDENGTVKFCDKTYIVPDPKMLERNLMWFLNASIVSGGKYDKL